MIRDWMIGTRSGVMCPSCDDTEMVWAISDDTVVRRCPVCCFSERATEHERKSRVYRIEDAEGIRDSNSGKALLVSAPDFLEDEWIPHSQIHNDSEVYKPGTTGVLIVSDWFAEKKGWV